MFGNALLHISSGQAFRVGSDPPCGGHHHLVIAHSGQFIQLFLLSGLFSLLPGLPFRLALGLGFLMSSAPCILVRFALGYILVCRFFLRIVRLRRLRLRGGDRAGSLLVLGVCLEWCGHLAIAEEGVVGAKLHIKVHF